MSDLKENQINEGNSTTQAPNEDLRAKERGSKLNLPYFLRAEPQE